MAVLLYGAGLRLLECARLRVKDIDFSVHQIVVRSGKGDRDRVTLLPAVIQPALHRQLDRVKAQHEPDLRVGAGWVELPHAVGQAEIEHGGYFTGLWTMSANERADRLRRGEHYGLVVRGSSRVIMYPIYREDGLLVAVQFRSGAATEGRVEQVQAALRRARPLAEFRQRLPDAV